jgi:hypothetical protein
LLRSIGRNIAALPEAHWKPDKPETGAIREWAEVNYLPSGWHSALRALRISGRRQRTVVITVVAMRVMKVAADAII